MASTVNTMLFVGTDGTPFSVSSYNASGAAAGTYLNCDMNQVAVSNSPQDFIVPMDCYLTDFIAGAPSGTVELISNGKATSIMIDYATQQASNAGRPAMKIPLAKGAQVRFKVISALAL